MQFLQQLLLLLGLVAKVVVHADDGEGGPDESQLEPMGSDEPEDDVPTERLSADKLEAVFKLIDKDGDGNIFGTDLHAFAAEMRVKRATTYEGEVFEELDTNKDGKLSLEEAVRMEEEAPSEDTRYLDSSKAMFKAADKDGDGILDQTEATSFISMDTDPAAEEAVAKADMHHTDKDGDGKLNLEEFGADNGEGSQEHFDKLDKNKDGFLDLKEMSAWASGRFYEEDQLLKLIRHADEDGDGSVSLRELIDAQDKEEAPDHYYHFDSWAADLEL